METKDKALQKLQDMPLADRIAAVAADVDSKQDEFRSIDAHELASLLGIEDAGQPGTVEEVFGPVSCRAGRAELYL